MLLHMPIIFIPLEESSEYQNDHFQAKYAKL